MIESELGKKDEPIALTCECGNHPDHLLCQEMRQIP